MNILFLPNFAKAKESHCMTKTSTCKSANEMMKTKDQNSLVFLPFWHSFLYYQIGHDQSKIDNGSCPIPKGI